MPCCRYGTSPNPLPRRVIARGNAQEPTLELHTLHLKVFRLSDGFGSANLPYSFVLLSSQDSVKTLCKHIVDAFPSHAHLPHRIWMIEADDLDGLNYPWSRLYTHGAEMVRGSDITIEEQRIQASDAFIVEFKQGNDWVVDASKVQGKKLPLQADVPPPLFSIETDFFNRLTKSTSSTASKVATAAGDFVSKLPSHSPFMRSVALGSSTSHGRPQEPGTLGLGNMCAFSVCLGHTSAKWSTGVTHVL